MIFTIAPDPQSLAQALADRLLLEAQAAKGRGQPLRIALSGGSTPTLFYEELGRRSMLIPWDVLHIYFSDERAVAPDHPESNFGHARALWLRTAPPYAHIYRILGELGAEQAARSYDDILPKEAGSSPFFDIVFLGFGTDGHIASLFPGTSLLTTERVVAVAATRQRSARVSLTLPTLIAARSRIVLAHGSAKATCLRQNLTASAETPIAMLLRQASVELWLDQAAATGLFPDPATGPQK
ncbi:MAG: 6-phosphogluconolactonase [Acidiferrobacter sp.]